MALTRVTETMALRQAREGLTNFLYPSTDGGWRDIYRSGWIPSFFNQQWGGAQWGTEMQDAATGATYKFEPATGQIQDDTIYAIGNSAAQTYGSQGFKVGESFTLDSVWLKLYKVQATVSTNYNLTIRIYSDSAGVPNAALGTAATISMRQLTSKTDGEWYRLSGLNVALTASTQYHIVCTFNSADASNYIVWKETLSRKYPHGAVNVGNATPTWTPAPMYAMCFLVEPAVSNRFLQTSGAFDKKLVFNDSTLLNQSKALIQPMKNFFDGQQFTYVLRGNYFQKGKPIADFVYGLDHDRISLTTHGTSGVGILTVYNSSGTAYIITGTTDLSTVAHKDISIAIRSVGDTNDYIKLYVNGAVEGTSITGQAIVFDNLFRELGTAWLGGGFPVAPAWTAGSLSSFAALPSTNGWTWTGTATQANAMSVANGKLYQAGSGYASTDTGYYAKTSAGLNNANGWVVNFKVRIPASSNTPNPGTTYNSVSLVVNDGTKGVAVLINEHFLQTTKSATAGPGATDFTVQGDFKSQEQVFTLCGKGSDYYLFNNGRLVVDGTGMLVTANTNNQILFGDFSAGAGVNGDAIWSYVEYYNTAAILPQASTGASISETIYWSGDKTAALKDLYNLGTPVSGKVYCGLSRGYIGEGVVQRETRRAISSLSTSSTTPVLAQDIEAFIIGSDLEISSLISAMVSAAGYTSWISNRIDGVISFLSSQSTSSTSSAAVNLSCSSKTDSPLGLHKTELVWCVNNGTVSSNIGSSQWSHSRTISVVSKP